MIITNVNMILEHEVVKGSLEVREGRIVALSDTLSQHSSAVNGDGAYLLPGLIELHTDNLEKFFTPRPKVNWPSGSAMASHDALMVSSGITTVLDAIALGYINDHGTRLANLERMLHTIVNSQQRGDNRAEHLLHLRCELPNADTANIFETLVEQGPVAMVSLMDHTPGQRQFVDSEKYRTYYMGKYGLNDQEMARFEAEQTEASELWSDKNRKHIAASARERGIALASHDDATVEHALESAALGCAVAEFPTTVAAAKASHEGGLQVMMGAPNIVRGGSHSGNVAAAELAREGVLDILSSDYYPMSMLDAAYQVANMEDNHYDLCQAIQMVSLTPALTLGMDDRGSICEGKRADLVLAKPNDDRLQVMQVWREGERVF
ncbi:alpha-D-ribose 1-methylphosphonate 5-triphosphate diphosphatase [Agarivorans sp. 1_MG-2023]|uniref:alpha-D-ribose 1-methylphosphonate 5-triphosphate diphosphatase n=1 Tax=Agarivorans sp. 1_MG-2023 TaxID=3062634 RepID=UPI0026E30B1A|nr:alpha-D-ribose 1-methylphosphonate 5-triphosphate diphosphatase [Agarivorans sp. 1_MG-2023]MDO6765129.1 alpha-D-ribose 1-methylphosphonate 5-triphosphate diphosphatase [Agarivorans sp. 1_MG-2023]